VNYAQWEERVPEEMKADAVWSVKVYRLALFAADLCWWDVRKLRADHFYRLADQLLSAVGAVSADLAEGYSRGDGRDCARFYGYGLGSAREGRDWYYKARHLLSDEVATHRIRLLTHIIRLLLHMTPNQRQAVSEVQTHYSRSPRSDLEALLEHVPFAAAGKAQSSPVTHYELRSTNPE
jgi:four helix bundle protein